MSNTKPDLNLSPCLRLSNFEQDDMYMTHGITHDMYMTHGITHNITWHLMNYLTRMPSLDLYMTLVTYITLDTYMTHDTLRLTSGTRINLDTMTQ